MNGLPVPKDGDRQKLPFFDIHWKNCLETGLYPVSRAYSNAVQLWDAAVWLRLACWFKLQNLLRSFVFSFSDTPRFG